MDVENLLAFDKDNFQILGDEISEVEVRKIRYSWRTTYAGGGIIKIKGRVNESFEIVPGQDMEQCRELLRQGLPGKVTAQLVKAD